MQPADVKPVIHAKWIETDIVSYDYGVREVKLLVCSNCNIGIKNGILGIANYCPCCGARMDAELKKVTQTRVV